MKTFQEEIIKIQVVTVKCDFCDFTVKKQYLHTCSVCRKDLCTIHSSFFYEGGSDSVTHISCPDHKDIIQKAFDKREKLEEHIPDVDDLIKQMMEK